MTTQRKPLLLAVDGNSLVHRVHHAQASSNLRHSDGRPLWAVRGTLTTIAGIAARFTPDAIVVGFDDPTGSVRREAYPQYKATRPEHPVEIRQQVLTVADVLRQLGVAIVVAPGYEADDVLASAAAEATAAGWRCLLATSDRDSFALVTDTVRLLRLGGPVADAPLLGPVGVAKETGVPPAAYRDLAALRGDTSDNIPGVHGIGKVTAAKLLGALGSLDAAFADLDAGGQKVLAAVGKAATAKLATPEARAIVARNRSLMAMRTDLPLPLRLGEPTGAGRLPLRDPRPVFDAVELGALTDAWTRVFRPSADASAAKPVSESRPVAAPPPAVVPPQRVAPVAERAAAVAVSAPAAAPSAALAGDPVGARVPTLPAAWPLTL